MKDNEIIAYLVTKEKNFICFFDFQIEINIVQSIP